MNNMFHLLFLLVLGDGGHVGLGLGEVLDDGRDLVVDLLHVYAPLHPLKLPGTDLVHYGGLLAHLAADLAPPSSSPGARGLYQLSTQGDHDHPEPLPAIRHLRGLLGVGGHQGARR